jgi:hypothetical protein
MDLTLTILKFAGVFVSGFGAIIASIPEHRRGKRNEKSRFREFWHKLSTKQSGLYIAIIGLFVAMLSQFAETIISAREGKEASDRYEGTQSSLSNQLFVAQETLGVMSRVATPVNEGLLVQEICQLPDTNGDNSIGKLKNYFDQCIKSCAAGDTNVPFRIMWPTGPTGDTNAIWIFTKTGTFDFDISQLLRECPTNSQLDEVKELLVTLENEFVDIRFWNDARPLFHMKATHSFKARDSVDLVYGLKTRTVLIDLQYYFPKKEWETFGYNISLYDIAGSYCGFRPPSVNLGHSQLKPVKIELQFDNYPLITQRTFRQHGSKVDLEIFLLPSLDDIMRSNDSNFNPFELVY